MEDVIAQMGQAGIGDQSFSEISFAGRAIKMNKAEDAKEIVDEIKNRVKVESLQLMGNTMGVDAAKLIGDELARHPEFQRARWSDMFTGRLKSEIPPALTYLCDGIIRSGAHLVELDLSDNAFGPIGVQGISALLRSKSCYGLKELRLNNNGLGPNGGKMLAGLLDSLYEESKAAGSPLALTTFVSGRGRLENEGAIALSKVFQKMGSLEYVSMPQNGINPDGIKALVSAFADNKSLKHLSLCDNTFTVSGAIALSKALPSLTQLEVLNLESCLIRTRGATSIAAVLSSDFKNLKELMCKYNEITVDGALRLIEASADLPALESLQLDGNNLGDDGKEMVRESLDACLKSHLLDSLSEDEGSLDDEDEEPEEVSDAEGGGDHEEPALLVEKLTASEFLSSPSPVAATRIAPADLTAHLAHLTTSFSEPSEVAQAVVSTCFRIAALLNLQSSNNKPILQLCESSMKVAALRDIPVSIFSNSIIVNLGLIKSEDKGFKLATTDLNGPLTALNHLISRDQLPQAVCQTISIFLSISGKKLTEFFRAKSLLEQTLFAKV